MFITFVFGVRKNQIQSKLSTIRREGKQMVIFSYNAILLSSMRRRMGRKKGKRKRKEKRTTDSCDIIQESQKQ